MNSVRRTFHNDEDNFVYQVFHHPKIVNCHITLLITVPCQTNLSGLSGTFTSPNYPSFPRTPENWNDQEGFVICRWQIKVQAGKEIQFQFGDFDLDESGEVKIYDGSGIIEPG